MTTSTPPSITKHRHQNLVVVPPPTNGTIGRWKVPLLANQPRRHSPTLSIAKSMVPASTKATKSSDNHQPPPPIYSVYGGRIGKRKPLCPVRSPTSTSTSHQHATTVKLSFIDQYQCNPGAYSKALMSTECATIRQNRNLSAPSSPLSITTPSSSHNDDEREESAAAAAAARRKSIPAAIFRLFPSLDSSLDEFVSQKTKSSAAATATTTTTTGSKQNANASDGRLPFVVDELGREIFYLRPHVNTCSVKWAKAAPMDVSIYPMCNYLAPAELECSSILRLLPEQYLSMKQSLVRAGRTLPRGTFKKRDAQKLCRVDVNKTSKVFEWFCKLGWIPNIQTARHSNQRFNNSLPMALTRRHSPGI